jgi:hypothetical protein
MVKYISTCIFPPIQAKLLEKIAFWIETTILNINASQIFLATHSQQIALEDGF